MSFEKGKTVSPLKKIGSSDKTGTLVRFLADDSIFESLDYEVEVLEKRFREIAFLIIEMKRNLRSLNFILRVA